MTHIETEIRGPLTKPRFDQLRRFLATEGRFITEKNRILLDYSTLLSEDNLRNRTLDIRARITNGVPELIIKKGKWGGSDSREEVSVLMQKGQFLHLIKAYALLGYTRAVLCFRNASVYTFRDVEFSLIEVPGHSYFFEAELISMNNEDVSSCHEKLLAICTELQLKPFSDEEWFAYVELLNKEANYTFDMDRDGLAYLRSHGIE